MAAKRDRNGRYDRVHEAERPSAREFLPEGVRAHGNVVVVHARVEKPGTTVAAHLQFGKFQRAAVNVAKDTLEREYAYGRISTEAYQAGLAYQNVLEIARGRRMGGRSFELSDRGCSISGHDWIILSHIERADEAVELIHITRSKIGMWGELVLSAVLGDGLTFSEVAERQRRKSDWGRRRIARVFREGLESLATELERRITTKSAAER